jgi:hypothetical protein
MFSLPCTAMLPMALMSSASRVFQDTPTILRHSTYIPPITHLEIATKALSPSLRMLLYIHMLQTGRKRTHLLGPCYLSYPTIITLSGQIRPRKDQHQALSQHKAEELCPHSYCPYTSTPVQDPMPWLYTPHLASSSQRNLHKPVFSSKLPQSLYLQLRVFV